MNDEKNSIIESFRTMAGKDELLFRVIECFPYPIQVYDTDGTSVLVNKAMLEEYHAVNADMIVGKYNVYKDPDVISTGQIDVLRRAFRGETVFFPDVRVPLEEISRRYGISDFDVEAVYQDITVFPIFDDRDQVMYVAALLINRRIYRGKNEIEKAKEYLENHWLDKFDLSETARVACLSKAHFSKLFKKHTGMTPLDYYTNNKIGKIKEMLADTNLSITQVFAACNMDYSGNAARSFKNKVGVTASEYRKKYF